MHGATLVLRASGARPVTIHRYFAPALRLASYSTETRTSSASSQPPPPPYRPPSSSKKPDRPSETKATSSAAPPNGPNVSAAAPATEKDAAAKAEQSSTTEKSTAVTEKGKEKEKSVSTSSSAKKGSRLQRIWVAVRDELKHYWHGTKLLGKEIKISYRLLRKLTRGKSLTRREDRQLKRTAKDLLRSIPFSVFLIVPFAEAALPIFLKLFPNMLPSTFAKDFELEERKRKLLKVRLETAKFLQTTIRESPLSATQKVQTSTAYKEFFRKVRSTGESPTTDDIMKVAALFEDDLTLDNLSRPQLISTCKYMNVNAFGTDNFLRHTIRSRMKKLRQDDKVLDAEGLDNLQDAELVHACQSRGIRTQNKSHDELRAELAQWIDLHVRQNLSGTLLFLCKAFSFTQEGSDATENMIASLKDVLSSLPDELVNETELDINDDKATPQQRLEVLQEQEDLIEDEAEQEAKEQEARRAKKEEEAAKKEEEAARKEEQAKAAKEAERTTTDADARTIDAAHEPAPVAPSGADDLATPTGTPDEPAATAAAEEQADARMTSEQLSELGQALSILSAKSSVLKERADLKALMEQHRASTVADESSAAASSPSAEQAEGDVPPPETSAEDDKAAAADAKRKADLSKRIGKMISQIDEQLEEYDRSVGARMNIVNVGEDGKIREADLRKALDVIAHRPEDDAISGIIDKLDVDHDGFVPIEDIVGLAEGEGLGIVLEEAESDKPRDSILQQGREIRHVDTTTPSTTSESASSPKKESSSKPRKEDIVSDD